MVYKSCFLFRHYLKRGSWTTCKAQHSSSQLNVPLMSVHRWAGPNNLLSWCGHAWKNKTTDRVSLLSNTEGLQILETTLAWRHGVISLLPEETFQSFPNQPLENLNKMSLIIIWGFGEHTTIFSTDSISTALIWSKCLFVLAWNRSCTLHKLGIRGCP